MIKIYWKAVKEDIDKQTWRIAQVHISELEMQSYAQEDESKASMKYILRFAESGIALVRTAIKEYLQQLSCDAVSDDTIDISKEGWEFVLKEGTGIDERSLAILIHRMVVSYVLYRWSMNWAPDATSNFRKEYETELEDIESVASSLTEPVKDKRTKYIKRDIEVEYE